MFSALGAETREITVSDWHRMNVGKRFWGVSLEQMADVNIRATIAKWIEGMLDNVEHGRGLFIRGDYRTGKTAAAVLCMKEVVRHKGTAYMVEATTITSDWIDKARFDEDQTVKDRILGVDLLVIDDLGMEKGQEWTKSLIEHIIRHRADRVKATIITSNVLSLKTLKEKYGEAMLEVMRSYCYPMEMRCEKWSNKDADALKTHFEGGAK